MRAARAKLSGIGRLIARLFRHTRSACCTVHEHLARELRDKPTPEFALKAGIKQDLQYPLAAATSRKLSIFLWLF
jgi:hypothetical protein